MSESAIIALGDVYESEEVPAWARSVVGRVIDDLHAALPADGACVERSPDSSIIACFDVEHALVNELLSAIEAAEADIGGFRPMAEIIGELGPAYEAVEAAIDAAHVAARAERSQSFRDGLLAALAIVAENRKAAEAERDRHNEDDEEEQAEQSEAALTMADYIENEIKALPEFEPDAAPVEHIQTEHERLALETCRQAERRLKSSLDRLDEVRAMLCSDIDRASIVAHIDADTAPRKHREEDAPNGFR
jgi:hypothetical protein